MLSDNDPAARALEQHLDFVAGKEAEEPTLDALEPDDRLRAHELIETADLLWELSDPPPLADDPVAAMLGLVPDADLVIDPKRLKRVRQVSGLRPSQVADALKKRGWSVNTANVVRWEQQGDQAMPPALISAVAAVLGTKPERITRKGAIADPGLTSVLSSARFDRIAGTWANLVGMSKEAARAALHTRMLTTVHRGEHPSDEQWFQILEGLVDAKQGRPEK